MKSKPKNAAASATVKVFVFLCFWLVSFDSNAQRSLSLDAIRLVSDARSQIGLTTSYDASYQPLSYPNGDISVHTGVCADVVVRAFRGQGLDLQKLLHEDMRSNFSQYPNRWNLRRPDSNIDHRRVPNLETFFKRKGHQLNTVTNTVAGYNSNFKPGDIVTWLIDSRLPHIGIVSDRSSAQGEPMIIHNIGQGTREELVLRRFPLIGHFRFSRQTRIATQQVTTSD